MRVAPAAVLATLLISASVSLAPSSQAATRPASSGIGAVASVKSQPAIALSTDKAAYKPGDLVHLTAKLTGLPGLNKQKLTLRAFHLGSSVSQPIVFQTDSTGTASIDWAPPATDYQGYLLSVALPLTSKHPSATSTIGVDVSSDWGKFVRYGFLTDFSTTDPTQMSNTIAKLNRFHINGLQFYDWQDSHNQPIAFANGQAPASWLDINHRQTYLATVQNLISLAHERGMKAMNYNLGYAAYQNAADQGVKPAWAIFNDDAQSIQATWPLPGFESDLYLQNPGNPGWQNYIMGREALVQTALPFDGWHVDQLGDAQVYDAVGNPVDLASGFQSLLTSAKRNLHYDLVMNAVDGFAQHEIAYSNATKFAYTEVWGSAQTLGDLTSIIENNWADTANLRSGSQNTVLAAYMDYNKANSAGTFNTPGVLLADAAIFAAGGDHIELGEHMLGKEYFPNANLKMSADLQNRLTAYYDFAVAYENLLRDGTTPVFPKVSISKVPFSLGAESAPNTVWVTARTQTNHLVVHLVNLRGLAGADWRDTDGNQVAPKPQSNLTLTVTVTQKVKSAFVASPDAGGLPQPLKFKQAGTKLTVTVPSLKYWDALVLSY